MTLFHCCLVPIIIISVLSGLSFSLLVSIQTKIVRLIVKVKCKPVCHQHTGDD